MTEEHYKKAMHYAVGVLSRSMHSEKMLEDKLLKKEFQPEIIAYVLERMKLLRALDDVAYANAFVRTYQNKGYGAYRIKNELYIRGINKQIAEEAIKAIEIPYDKLIKLLNSKLHGDVSDYKQNEKAKAMLFRRGYSGAEIAEIFAIYTQMLEENIDEY